MRKKIGGDFIETVRGLGYRLAAAEEKKKDAEGTGTKKGAQDGS